jgi:hypothetical protein
MRWSCWLSLAVVVALGTSGCGADPKNQPEPIEVAGELPITSIGSVAFGVGRFTVDFSALGGIPGTVTLDLRSEGGTVGTLSVTADFRVAKKFGALLRSGDCELPTSAKVISFRPGVVPELEVPTVESYDIPPEWVGPLGRVMMSVTYESVSYRSRFVSVLRRNPAGEEFGDLIVVPPGDVDWGVEFDLDESFAPPDIYYQYYDVEGTFCGDDL